MFATRLTELGIQKLTAAQAAETAVVFATLALGDGTAVTPDPNQIALNNEVWRGAVGAVYVDPVNANQIIVENVLPDGVGGWTIREAGILDDAGDLIAVASVPDTYKPLVAEGSVRQISVRLVLVIGDTATVQLSVNSDLVLATQAYAIDAAAAAASQTEASLTQYVDQTVQSEASSRQSKDNELQGELNSLSGDISVLQSSVVPVGGMIQFGGEIAPTGWLLCDGTAYSQDTYPALYAILGTRFGSNGSGTFRVPNIQERFPIGASSVYELGSEGGTVETILELKHIPKHRHTAAVLGQQTFTATGGDAPGPRNFLLRTAGTEADVTGYAGGEPGGPVGNAEPHNNMPPYVAVTFLIRAQ